MIILRRRLYKFVCSKPGEHNGTFRGHNLAFVTATKALELFWSNDTLARETEAKGEMMARELQRIVNKYPQAPGTVKGRGMLRGIDFENVELAGKVSEVAFESKLIIETSGPESNVLKLLPPLTISEADLRKGLEIIDRSVGEALNRLGAAPDKTASGS